MQSALVLGRAAPAARPWVLAVGDTVRIDDQTWTITALGEVAEKNLANLGHVTLVFDGDSEPRMPGAVHLAGIDEVPALVQGAQLVFE